jgi:hypothetical protein
LASAAAQGAAKDLFNDFRTVVLTIIGFYFGTETIVSVAKIVRVSQGTGNINAAAIQRADRDLVTPPQTGSSSS